MSTSVTLPVSGPWAAAGFAQAQWSAMAAFWFAGGGIHGDYSSTFLQGKGDSSGMHVKVEPGSATWLGQYAELDSEATIDIASNSSGNPRIDRVCLRRDPTGKTMILTRIAGTPGVTPAVPALTAQDLPICQVAVANGAVTIAASNVTEDRLFFPLGTIPVTGPANYPASPLIGQGIIDAGIDKFWDGTVWQTHMVGADTGWSTVASHGVGWSTFAGSPLQVRKLGDLVELRGRLAKGGTSTSLVTTLAGSFAPTYGAYAITTLSAGGSVAGLNINTDGTVVLSNPAVTALANGDYLDLWASWRTT
jgi:hypothetical protein